MLCRNELELLAHGTNQSGDDQLEVVLAGYGLRLPCQSSFFLLLALPTNENLAIDRRDSTCIDLRLGFVLVLGGHFLM